MRDTGATISPINAFLLLQGVETLSLRLDRHKDNAKKVVEYLSKHPLVEKVNHPSLDNHPQNALYKKYFPMVVVRYSHLISKVARTQHLSSSII